MSPVAPFVSLCLAVSLLTSGCSRPRRVVGSEYGRPRLERVRDADVADEQNALALRLMHQGKDEEAEKALKRALAADVTHGPAHNNLGKIYYRQRKFYLAAWEFQYAIKLMPRQPEPRNNLGLVFEEVGKLQDAVNWYGEAVDLQPDNPHFVGNLARARIRHGDKGDEVAALLQKVIESDTRSAWVSWAKERLARLNNRERDHPPR